MWIANGWKDYELIDCGGGEKLERWGDKLLVRPDPQAIWNTPRNHRGWRMPDARYARSSSGGGQWADKSERSKIRFDPVKEPDHKGKRPYIGTKTKKMQSRVRQMEQRIGREIEEKEGLLQDVEEILRGKA